MTAKHPHPTSRILTVAEVLADGGPVEDEMDAATQVLDALHDLGALTPGSGSDEELITVGPYQGLTQGQAALAVLMSDVSEEVYCAGWLHDCEYEIWRLIHDGGRWAGVEAGDLALLTVISETAERLDRWIIWSEDDEGTFEAVPLVDWRARYDAWKAARAAQ